MTGPLTHETFWAMTGTKLCDDFGLKKASDGTCSVKPVIIPRPSPNAPNEPPFLSNHPELKNCFEIVKQKTNADVEARRK